MLSQVLSRRKWKLYAHERHIIVVNGTREKFTHPLMKAFIWALYLPTYPNATIEVRIGDKYKPDVIALTDSHDLYNPSAPLFWGEAGQVGRDKIKSLVRRFPDTHFVIGKWDTRLTNLEEMVTDIIDGYPRNAPFDLLNFPSGCEKLIDDDGHINIAFADVQMVRLGGNESA